MHRWELPQASVHPEEYRTHQYAGDKLGGQSRAEEHGARPNEHRYANHSDRRRDPKRVQPLANTTATVQPIRHCGAGRAESGGKELRQKNLYHVISP
jgi:hypothetical protein